MLTKSWVPFSYHHKTRTKSTASRLVFHVENLLPLSTAIFYYSSSSAKTLILYWLLYISFYCSYEIGYIVNDRVSVKIEENPTIRNNPFPNISTKLLIFIKLLSAIIILILAQILVGFEKYYFVMLLVPSVAPFIFHVHNKLRRSSFRTLTFALLVISSALPAFITLYIYQSFEYNELAPFIFILVFRLPTRLLGYLHSKHIIKYRFSKKEEIIYLASALSLLIALHSTEILAFASNKLYSFTMLAAITFSSIELVLVFANSIKKYIRQSR